MQTVKFLLRDIEPQLVAEWQKHFAGVSAVEASCGDIFAMDADAVVSPANSFGFMDGGIDLVYSRRFGWDLQRRLQEMLREQYDGELLVGQAVILETGDPTIKYLVSAPTMRVPANISGTVNAYLAFRAIIRTVDRLNRSKPAAIQTVLCPGLGTATGELPFALCARQMRAAYDDTFGETATPPSVNDAMIDHYALLRAD